MSANTCDPVVAGGTGICIVISLAASVVVERCISADDLSFSCVHTKKKNFIQDLGVCMGVWVGVSRCFVSARADRRFRVQFPVDLFLISSLYRRFVIL